jgi:hypothetical protein
MKFNPKQSLSRASSKYFIFSDLTFIGLKLRPLTAKENKGDNKATTENGQMTPHHGL